MFMSSASIGAKTALRVFIIQTGAVSNSHCFVVESPRSFSTSSGVTSSKAGRLCMFCETSKVGGLESLVDSRMSSVFCRKIQRGRLVKFQARLLMVETRSNSTISRVICHHLVRLQSCVVGE